MFPLRIQAELPEFGNNQEDAEVDAASEKVTGSYTARSTADEGNPDNCDALSEVSDLEWDTDLETEGISPRKLEICWCPCSRRLRVLTD